MPLRVTQLLQPFSHFIRLLTFQFLFAQICWSIQNFLVNSMAVLHLTRWNCSLLLLNWDLIPSLWTTKVTACTLIVNVDTSTALTGTATLKRNVGAMLADECSHTVATTVPGTLLSRAPEAHHGSADVSTRGCGKRRPDDSGVGEASPEATEEASSSVGRLEVSTSVEKLAASVEVRRLSRCIAASMLVTWFCCLERCICSEGSCGAF
jgi:hypothetical protein